MTRLRAARAALTAAVVLCSLVAVASAGAAGLAGARPDLGDERHGRRQPGDRARAIGRRRRRLVGRRRRRSHRARAQARGRHVVGAAHVAAPVSSTPLFPASTATATHRRLHLRRRHDDRDLGRRGAGADAHAAPGGGPHDRRLRGQRRGRCRARRLVRQLRPSSRSATGRAPRERSCCAPIPYAGGIGNAVSSARVAINASGTAAVIFHAGTLRAITRTATVDWPATPEIVEDARDGDGRSVARHRRSRERLRGLRVHPPPARASCARALRPRGRPCLAAVGRSQPGDGRLAVSVLNMQVNPAGTDGAGLAADGGGGLRASRRATARRRRTRGAPTEDVSDAARDRLRRRRSATTAAWSRPGSADAGNVGPGARALAGRRGHLGRHPHRSAPRTPTARCPRSRPTGSATSRPSARLGRQRTIPSCSPSTTRPRRSSRRRP